MNYFQLCIFVIYHVVLIRKTTKSPSLQLLIALSLVLLISCSKNSVNNSEEQFSCDDLERFEAFIQQTSLQKDYAESYSQNGDILTIDFAQSNSITLEGMCIEALIETEEKSRLTIRFSQGNEISLAMGNFIELDYQYNPYGITPLSGQLSVYSSVPVKVECRIAKRTEGDQEVHHVFQERQGDFSLPVLGFYYNYSNEAYISIYDNTKVYYRDTIKQTIGERPAYLPVIIADINHKDNVEPGMHLVSYRSSVPTSPFIFDYTGSFRHVFDFRNHPEFGELNYDVGMERLENGNYYFGKWQSSSIYEMDVLGKVINIWDISPYEFHHNVQERANGNFLITASAYDAHDSGKLAIEDWIIELDRNTGSIINAWNLKNSLDETRQIMGWATYDNIVDWAHANAVIEDPGDGNIIVSCRTQGLVKLDRDNKVVWIIANHKSWGTNRTGEALDSYLLSPVDRNGQPITDVRVLEGESNHPDFEWPWYQHAPYVSEAGHLFLFDNGDNRNFMPAQRYSRAVEYVIDEDAMTIQQVWQYGKERGSETFSRIVSDVDILPSTGNVYFCPGSRVNNSGGNFGGKIIELDYQTKEIYQEFRINAPDIVFHRAEKLYLYPEKY